ncbi:FadR/GntR family transcriptional regulator [Uliginosibacterium sp. TH139]|jgi:DNA-binding FadR family transcriptional regulator|uniref:FadR/GntR family transcriptional regulator n=1 Tax=Uliginosibacterium sp. TH139 TaxID=2067453 RepID=UPI000C7E58BA|nr:FadR/GntR family transcriptional regulator [Uliginosibacterium sp. TH139]PLK50351.1 GntR family transcriptional regulator [Uliginosibacterium sp. TH139]
MNKADGSLLPARKRGPSLVETVMNDLAGKIRNGVYRAGAKLPTEPEVMAEHGVSRTVVRETMSRLQAAGLVETRHGVGTFVLAQPVASPLHMDSATAMTIRELLAMLELRISVETEAAGLAALRRTDAQVEEMRQALREFDDELSTGGSSVDADFKFHLLVAQATGNPYFENFYRQLGINTIPRTRLDTSVFSSAPGQGYLRRSNEEHLSILEAIARRDPENARAGMRLHLSNSRERLRLASEEAERRKEG